MNWNPEIGIPLAIGGVLVLIAIAVFGRPRKPDQGRRMDTGKPERSGIRREPHLGEEGEGDEAMRIGDLDEFGQDEAKDMLRWAKGIAAGHSMDELADMEGMEGDQVEAFKAQVASLAAAPQFKQQVARLTSGQVSPGRTVARVWWDDPTKDVSKGATRYVSGGMDAVWAIGADPTLVAGKDVHLAAGERAVWSVAMESWTS